MRVGAGPHRQVVLPGESQRLVVLRLEDQARVVDLEDVDVGEMAVERRRVGDGVHAVEGVGDVDEPVLLPDRRDRVLEGEPARDLPLEEEADHLALGVGLDLLAGDHDQVAVARLVHRLERAAEGVVVGDRDRAEALGQGVVDELRRVDLAVVRPVRVHVEVGDDPRPVAERVGRACATASSAA